MEFLGGSWTGVIHWDPPVQASVPKPRQQQQQESFAVLYRHCYHVQYVWFKTYISNVLKLFTWPPGDSRTSFKNHTELVR